MIDLKLGQEHIPPKEEQHIEEMVELLRSNLIRKYAAGETLRHFHPKMHGCLQAKFVIKEDLPRHLKKGLFAQAGTYDAWIRYSNAPPKIQDDRKASGRGVAIKVLNVSGESLLPDPIGVSTQDFVMTTSPVLSAGHAANYRKALIALVKGFPHNLSYILWPDNWRRLALTIRFMKKHRNLLNVDYFSGGPFRFGDESTAVKFKVSPVKNRILPTSGKPSVPYFLKERLIQDLKDKGVEFEMFVQFQKDPKKEPIEDTSQIWKTPFEKVATIHILKQEFNTQERMMFAENLSFSPWHGLKAHRPLGGINRARKAVYDELAKFRRERNGVTG